MAEEEIFDYLSSMKITMRLMRKTDLYHGYPQLEAVEGIKSANCLIPNFHPNKEMMIDLDLVPLS